MVKEKAINKYKAALVLLDDVIEKAERQYEDERENGYRGCYSYTKGYSEYCEGEMNGQITVIRRILLEADKECR